MLRPAERPAWRSLRLLGLAAAAAGLLIYGASVGVIVGAARPTADGASTPPAAARVFGPFAPSSTGSASTPPQEGGAAISASVTVLPLPVRPTAFTTALPDGRAVVAVRAALAQRGLPYVWGGDGPANGEAGFDCSGLTTFSYAAAGIGIPRTAHTQYYAGPHVQAGTPLQPGDLVFYGTAAFVHHVGVYLGNGKMINAPTFGKPVQVAYYRWNGDDFLGATRPAATGTTSIGPPPAAPVPTPGHPAAPKTFPAPSAPPPSPIFDPTASQPPEAQPAQQAGTNIGLPPPAQQSSTPNSAVTSSGGQASQPSAASPETDATTTTRSATSSTTPTQSVPPPPTTNGP